ncbi:DeoR/GlpR family DNA-binding transcription regulator [Microbacterium betulae]|uniref:Lactose phosphotransferase system repressor n=1 Tax=Microbacterium betulae TaxID=2981139 RepID=A0AA97I5Z4_9MICO|nr:DeoR/GlpR family DNA-binding transcription regulator [Microbacterium sp. AB]WOF22067.1 DeoR/GlpR family DNA-binding transcription regulator [Microbacterium sp. AB]
MTAGDADGKRRERRLPAGRKAELAAYVAANRQVTVAELAERFAVSIDTVRRDLDQLDAEGRLIRTHGGAVSTDAGAPPDQGLGVRMRMRAEEKETIGELAARLVPDGAVVVVNSGTTTLAVARHLRDHRDLTIATNSLVLPGEVSPTALRELYVFGGSVRTITQATTGPVSFRPTAAGPDMDIRADLAIIGVGAVSPDGYSTSNLADAAMMSEMMSHAARVAVVADSSKFGHRLFARVAPLGAASFLVTDASPPDDLSRALLAAEVEILTPASAAGAQRS